MYSNRPLDFGHILFYRRSSRAFHIDDPSVTAIRCHLGFTQRQFAALLGISAATLKNWEQGRRKPEGAARVLLCVAAKFPEAVLETVRA
jgi:putative transcriptional regulator